ncbi:MAG: RNA polymerase sigma factor [Terriglobia bacterium]
MDGACLELAASNSVPRAQSPPVDELVLIARAQAGDRLAFESLVRLYERDVLKLILRMVRSSEEAADIYQEVFLKVYRSLGRFRGQSEFSTWIYRVVVNVCLDHLRRQKRKAEIQAPRPGDGKPEFFHTVAEDRPELDPERARQSREINRRLTAALGRLSPRERIVFELRHYEGLRLRAIGERVGATEETAKNCLFRATRKLREELADLL